MSAMERVPEYQSIDQIVDQLVVMFGEKLSRDALFTIVESYDGDINEAANAVMSIINESPADNAAEENASFAASAQTKALNSSSAGSLSNASSASVSSRVAPSPGAFRLQNSHSTKKKPNFCPPEIQTIIDHHVNGTRVLIFMRGLSGSGKSFLAKYIVNETIGQSYDDYKRHVCSTDDFFISSNGTYRHDKYRLSEAHDWNQARVRCMLQQGVSPVIVDNTNVEMWEMLPYTRDGVANGYIIEVLEPRTPWSKNAGLLAKKNVHNVPYLLIKRKLENYQEGLTGKGLIDSFKLTYPKKLIPPILRTFPAFVPLNKTIVPNTHLNSMTNVLNNLENTHQRTSVGDDIQLRTEGNCSVGADTTEIKTVQPVNQREMDRRQQYEEVQRLLDSIDSFSKQWDNNPSWEESAEQSKQEPKASTSLNPKPERIKKRIDKPMITTEGIQTAESINACQDWQIFLPSLRPKATIIKYKVSENFVDKRDNSTSMNEDSKNVNDKEIIGCSRDINHSYISCESEKIPDIRMFDKSTMTNDSTITDDVRCKNEEKHFIAFRKLFHNISRAVLRDIFDKCHGNVNWAVEIIFDGMASKNIDSSHSDELSDVDDDEEEIHQDQCECLAAYGVIPNVAIPIKANDEIIAVDSRQSNITEPPKRVKKKIALSESSIQLKRQIEKSVFINDDHYPQYCLERIKKRRGDHLKRGDLSLSLNTDDYGTVPRNDDRNLVIATTSDASSGHYINSSTTDLSDDDDDVANCTNDAETTVSIDLNKDLLSQIDEYFGRQEIQYYPSNINKNINIPISIFNQINALWIESLVYQIDEQTKQINLMVQQDEEFARQILSKEAELASAGQEPAVPDFKEIMDMDLALSIYQKNVAEWRKNEPNDYAAIMTRDKLYNLFPDMSHEILSELLMAHDNNFRATVESLLMSTGNAGILQEKNGVNKYVMQKELEHKQKLLENEKNAQSDCPLLSQDDMVSYEIANQYRGKAESHLHIRNLNNEKVLEYTRRGMTEVASYYSDVAQYHTSQYELFNSRAVVMFVKANAKKNPRDNTLDLHYLRVTEATQAMDVYLDSHIQRLRNQSANQRSGVRDWLFIITGRGLHSVGGAKLRPAMKKRLGVRGLPFVHLNPGLLTVYISPHDLLTNELGN